MAVTLDNLYKQFVAPDGSVAPIIDIASFSLDAGEQASLIGSSGSGKTTLLHLIAGILTPDRGAIYFHVHPLTAQGDSKVLNYHAPTNGVNITALSESERDIFRGKHMGYIFQTHHLLPGFTALENVLLGMSFTGRASDPQWARHLLNEVGLSDRLHYKPEKLSVGQQQRVAVARALANRPQLVLADEPTGALDIKNAQQVIDLIRKLCEEVKASLLMVTHDLEIARQLPRVVDLKELNKASREK